MLRRLRLNLGGRGGKRGGDGSDPEKKHTSHPNDGDGDDDGNMVSLVHLTHQESRHAHSPRIHHPTDPERHDSYSTSDRHRSYRPSNNDPHHDNHETHIQPSSSSSSSSSSLTQEHHNHEHNHHHSDSDPAPPSITSSPSNPSVVPHHHNQDIKHEQETPSSVSCSRSSSITLDQYEELFAAAVHNDERQVEMLLTGMGPDQEPYAKMECIPSNKHRDHLDEIMSPSDNNNTHHSNIINTPSSSSSTSSSDPINKPLSSSSSSSAVLDLHYSDPRDGATVLHRAAAHGSIAVMHLLLDRFHANVHVLDRLGATPLHYAAAALQRDALSALLARGASPNTRDLYGYSPLHLALKLVVRERPEQRRSTTNNLMDYIITSSCTAHHNDHHHNNNNTDNNIDNNSNNTNHLNTDKEWEQRRQAAEILLLFGADLNFKREDGSNALHMACLSGDVSAVSFLLQHGAPVNSRDRRGETPLMKAVGMNQVQVVDCMLALNHHNHTHHHHHNRTSSNIKEDTRQTMIKARDEDGLSVIHQCARNGSGTIMKMIMARIPSTMTSVLLQESAGPDQQTPLHLAVAANHVQVAKSLIFLGADINAQDRQGDTPMHVAMRYNLIDLIKLLHASGARTDVKNGARETVRRMARAKNIRLDRLGKFHDLVLA